MIKKLLFVLLLCLLMVPSSAYAPRAFASDPEGGKIIWKDVSVPVPLDVEFELAKGDPGGVYRKLIALQTKFPQGKYWNHWVSDISQAADNLKARNDETYADAVSDVPCAYHPGIGINVYDCNYYDGGMQCWGFACRLFFLVFGIRTSQMTEVYSNQDIRVGDWVSLKNTQHYGVVLSVSGSYFTMAAANVDGNCRIDWGSKTYTKSQIGYYKRATNYDEINSSNPPSGTLDIGGILDGVKNYSTGEYGTFDVYINNELKANDVSDYVNENLQDGSTYLIKDIKAKDGYSYDGTSQTFSGKITGGNTSTVWLTFNSCKLVVKGYLDKQISDTLGYYGTFDVYIDGILKANDVKDFNQRATKGSLYEIKDIKAKNGYKYENVYSGSLTGTVGSGTKTVILSFNTIGESSCDWVETAKLPGNVTASNFDIQYNNHYQKSAASSPGTGWTKVSGSETTRYEPTGEEDLRQPYPASNANNTTLVLVDRYYYHYCATDGNVDYWQHGNYNRYGLGIRPGKNDLSYYSVAATHKDKDNPNINYYELTWTAKGTTETGWSGTVWCGHSPASRYWYLNYVYERRQPVTYYTWVKDSGWTMTRDNSASLVTFRYRLKNGCGSRGMTLPAGLTEIRSSAFEGSKSIEEVTIPNGVTSIGERAFANCTNLIVIRIPNSVMSIGSYAFLNDSRVTLNCQSDNTACSDYARNNNISLRIGY